MFHLTVRNVSDEVVEALKQRSAANGRSVEAEHRELLRAVLLGTNEDFAVRAAALRRRLRSSADSADIIRTDRDRDITVSAGVLANPARRMKSDS